MFPVRFCNIFKAADFVGIGLHAWGAKLRQHLQLLCNSQSCLNSSLVLLNFNSSKKKKKAFVYAAVSVTKDNSSSSTETAVTLGQRESSKASSTSSTATNFLCLLFQSFVPQVRVSKVGSQQLELIIHTNYCIQNVFPGHGRGGIYWKQGK